MRKNALRLFAAAVLVAVLAVPASASGMSGPVDGVWGWWAWAWSWLMEKAGPEILTDGLVGEGPQVLGAGNGLFNKSGPEICPDGLAAEEPQGLGAGGRLGGKSGPQILPDGLMIEGSEGLLGSLVER